MSICLSCEDVSLVVEENHVAPWDSEKINEPSISVCASKLRSVSVMQFKPDRVQYALDSDWKA
jgi:hypothetical protein